MGEPGRRRVLNSRAATGIASGFTISRSTLVLVIMGLVDHVRMLVMMQSRLFGMKRRMRVITSVHMLMDMPMLVRVNMRMGVRMHQVAMTVNMAVLMRMSMVMGVLMGMGVGRAVIVAVFRIGHLALLSPNGWILPAC